MRYSSEVNRNCIQRWKSRADCFTRNCDVLLAVCILGSWKRIIGWVVAGVLQRWASLSQLQSSSQRRPFWLLFRGLFLIRAGVKKMAAQPWRSCRWADWENTSHSILCAVFAEAQQKVTRFKRVWYLPVDLHRLTKQMCCVQVLLRMLLRCSLPELVKCALISRSWKVSLLYRWCN